MATQTEIEMLEAEVKMQGQIVRELKTAGEDAAEAIATLIEKKKALAAAKGEEFESGKKKGKKKKKKGGDGGEANGGMTKKEERMRAREEAARRAAEGPSGKIADLVGESNYGRYSMVRSDSLTEREFVKLETLGPEDAGRTVTIRGFLETVRGQGKRAFVIIRSSVHTLQCHFSGAKGMTKFLTSITKESVIDVQGELAVPPEPISSVTKSGIELQLTHCYVVNAASSVLPFQIKDASAPNTGDEDQSEAIADAEAGADADAGPSDERAFAKVAQNVRLDNRWIDLRTRANQAIFRMRSIMVNAFRSHLTSLGFVEINSPKIIATASEGGAEVFHVDFFGDKAYLAQSPQLYKQMAICGGLDRVFEVGPVFRAENSNTNRHLCEFVGMDLECAFTEHYHEVLEIIGDLLVAVFNELSSEKYADLRAAIREQHPFEDLVYPQKTLIINYDEGVEMLREAGVPLGDGAHGDLDTNAEKELGRLVKEKYNTDVFLLDRYPSSVRPFYTMVDAEDPSVSLSYDAIVRGREILSGAQRIHDPDMLVERANSLGVDLTPIQSYVDSFKHGAPPHAGCGLGAERLLMCFLGLNNVRKVSMFPRDPSRVLP